MSFTIRRTRTAIRKFDPDQKFWHGARLLIDENGCGILETYWRNPELAGIWLLTYDVISKCVTQLLQQQLIEPDGTSEHGMRSYRISEKGRKRLG